MGDRKGSSSLSTPPLEKTFAEQLSPSLPSVDERAAQACSRGLPVVGGAVDGGANSPSLSALRGGGGQEKPLVRSRLLLLGWPAGRALRQAGARKAGEATLTSVGPLRSLGVAAVWGLWSLVVSGWAPRPMRGIAQRGRRQPAGGFFRFLGREARVGSGDPAADRLGRSKASEGCDPSCRSASPGFLCCHDPNGDNEMNSRRETDLSIIAGSGR